jgi:hypothetical protein
MPAPRGDRRAWPPAAILAVTLGGGAASVILVTVFAGMAYLAGAASPAGRPAGARVDLQLPESVRVGRPATLRLTVINARATPIKATQLFVDSELLDRLDAVVVRPSRGSAASLPPWLQGRSYQLDSVVDPGKSLAVCLDFKPRTAGALSGLVALTLGDRSVSWPVVLPVAGQSERRPVGSRPSRRPAADTSGSTDRH